MIHLNVAVLNVVSGSLIPLLVAALLHWSAPSWVKAVLNAVLTVGASVCALAVTHNGLLTKQEVVGIALTFLVSGSAHAHLWVPFGFTGFFQKHFGSFLKQPEVVALLADPRMVAIEKLIQKDAGAWQVPSVFAGSPEQTITNIEPVAQDVLDIGDIALGGKVSSPAQAALAAAKKLLENS